MEENPDRMFVQQIQDTMLEFLGRNVLGPYAWTKLAPEDKERTRNAVILAFRGLVIDKTEPAPKAKKPRPARATPKGGPAK